jgi:uncharacterized membrane protein
MPENEPGMHEGAGQGKPAERARWFAAMGYLSFLSIIALGQTRGDRFIRFHASQGFLLFLTEILCIAAALILEATVGRIKIAGLIIVGLFILVTGTAALMLSAIGFVKALFGEYWNMPFLGEWKDRVPDLNWR